MKSLTELYILYYQHVDKKRSKGEKSWPSLSVFIHEYHKEYIEKIFAELKRERECVDYYASEFHDEFLLCQERILPHPDISSTYFEYDTGKENLAYGRLARETKKKREINL